MKRLRITILAITMIVAVTSLGALPASAGMHRAAHNHRTHKQDPYRHRMFKATNGSRSSHHRGRVSLSDRISALAQRHSAEMAKRGRLFHTSNVGRYLAGVNWHRWGENIGYMHGEDVQLLEQAFMNSPVHRENILNGGFHHVAVGTVYSKGRLWVTVFFYG
ncbi:MAG: CAP domain-containing protein [Actinomycetota bacterium]